LGHVAHSRHTLETISDGSILEFTYPKGPVSSLTADRGQTSYLGSQRTMAHNELAQGMASTDHIILGNHAVNRTKGSMPASALSCDPDLHLVGLDPMVHGEHTLETTLEGLHPEVHPREGPSALSHYWP
jgi:hypothetical protein